MHEREQELVGLLSKQCTNMEDVHKLLKSLFKSTLEEMLEAEMDEHLGYQKHKDRRDVSFLTTRCYT